MIRGRITIGICLKEDITAVVGDSESPKLILLILLLLIIFFFFKFVHDNKTFSHQQHFKTVL